MTVAKTHLMFQGDARSALTLYGEVFPDFVIESEETYGEDEGAPPGSLKLAHVSFAGHALLIFDSPPVHDFNFTPSMSLYVEIAGRDAFDRAFSSLSEGGEVMMPPGDYGFAEWYAWCADRFGVSWQIALSSGS